MTSLREAARALVAEIEPWRGKLSGQLDARAEELREAADAPPPGLATPEISFEGENPGEDDERCESLVLRWPTLSIFIEAGEYAIKEGDGPAYRPGAHKLPSYGAALEIGDEIGKTNAPPPGLEGVRRRLEELWEDGVNVGLAHEERSAVWETAERDDMLAELLAMFEAPAAVLRGRPEVKSIHAEAEVFPSDVPAAWCVQFWDRDEGNIWLVTFNAENAEELAEEYARAKAGGFYRKPPPPQLKVVK
jgi:hypothetical protein